MKLVVGMIVAGVALCSAEMLMHPTVTAAQAPPARGASSRTASTGPVDRLLAFDANHDGKLTKEELADERLQNLFARADANKDGTVTREELTALFAQEAPATTFGGPGGPRGPGGGRGFGGPGGPGGRGGGRGFGGPGGPGEAGAQGEGGPRGFGGLSGPGGRGGGPQMGQIMPSFLQERLSLSADQKRQVEALQKDVDSRLNKILTVDQQQQLKTMRESGPGGRGFGGPGGPGGPGVPGGGRSFGPPPDGFGPPPDGFGPPPGDFSDAGRL